MPRTLLRLGVVVSWSVVFAAGSAASAQDRPVVFIHGVASDSETWEQTASRLQGQLRIAAERADVSWRNSIEAQGSAVHARYGRLPESTIAVGHSLGGLVARQWSRSRELGGLITLASPNRGAPLANHINEWLAFNSALFDAVGSAFSSLGNASYDQWWWVYSAVAGALNWGGYIADFSVHHLLVEMGMQSVVPFVQQVYVGSPYLDALNGDVGREAAAVPARVGIVNTASEYWRGGPFRLKNPDYAGELSTLTTAAAAALDYYGFRVYAEADPLDWEGQSLAFGLWDAAFWLWNFEEFWCRATSDDRPIWSGHCLPNDGFVPTWSQFYPGATVNFEVNGGPVHTEETRQLDEYVFAALTNFMHVPARGGESEETPHGSLPLNPLPPASSPPASSPPGKPSAPPSSPTLPSSPPPAPPPPPPSGGPDTLMPHQAIYAGQWVVSSDERFYLAYQDDGNLVLYRHDAVPLWHTATAGRSPGQAVMQLDGNLLVYDASGRPVWASGTVGFDGAWLIVQNDGNMVIYAPSGAPVWASGTTGGR